ncbi:MAG: transglutaminase domain-containing protein [Nocardioidaceae bacterium]
MTADDYTPYGERPPTPELVELRLRAEQLVRDRQDGELLALVEELRTDEQMWSHLWAPSVAIAARRSARGDALVLLQDAVDNGFSQPELFEGELEEHFGTEPSWWALTAQMESNVPAPPLTLLEWPDPGASVPLHLYAISAEREGQLRELLPAPLPSAWSTALCLLEWVRLRWEHANDHVDEPDALDVLQRVDAGQRFACVEYSIVLSQVLNAVQIPARRVDLRQANHHVGVGRGHVVSEAWIDDLDRWVLLDGQHGSYWSGDDDEPLGLRELQRRHRAGEGAHMVSVVDKISDQAASTWLSYVASASTTGYTWAEDAFSPVFQDMGIVKTDRLLHDGDLAYPHLSMVSIGLGGTLEQPTVRLSSAHPYAQGFQVRDGDSVEDVAPGDARWALALTSGRHDVEIRTRTPYGSTAPCRLDYQAR